MWRARSFFAAVLIAATGSVSVAETWTIRPVPRPIPSVYSGPIFRPVLRPAPETPVVEADSAPTLVPVTPVVENVVPSEDKVEGVSVEEMPSDNLPSPLIEAEDEEKVTVTSLEPEISPEDATVMVSTDPMLMGGPNYFRPSLRPDTFEAPVLASVSSMRPKTRPKSLVVPAAAVVTKPAPAQSVPRPTPVAKPKPPAVPARPADVVMIGDSITAGGRWSERFPGVRVVNRGVSGDTGQKILARMDGILATRPKTALVMFGINDIYGEVPVEKILQRYDKIVSILLARKITVVIQSTLTCSGHICGEKLNRVHDLNAGLYKMAKRRKLKFVDINKGLSDRGGLKRAYSRDGVHMNGDGYAIWYAMLKPYIKS